MKRFVFVAMAVILSACDTMGGFGMSDRPRPPQQHMISSPNGEPLGYASDRSRCEALLAEWFSAADTDRNGQLSDAEMYADAVRWFRRADADRDGAITVEELTALRRTIPAPGAAPQQPERRTRAERDALVVREPDPVMAADINLDFRVSEAELLAMAGRRYATLSRHGSVDRAAVMAECERRRFG